MSQCWVSQDLGRELNRLDAADRYEAMQLEWGRVLRQRFIDSATVKSNDELPLPSCFKNAPAVWVNWREIMDEFLSDTTEDNRTDSASIVALCATGKATEAHLLAAAFLARAADWYVQTYADDTADVYAEELRAQGDF